MPSRSEFQSPSNRGVVVYSDFSSEFDIHPDKNDVVRVINDDAVGTSIRNLLLTNRGERLMKPTIGSSIRDLLFEPITPIMQSILRDKITNTITNFEPRARLIEVVVTGNVDENAYAISITYSTINRVEPITSTFILNRIR